MSHQRLANYLRSHRKKVALSQDDVAFLLGAWSGAKVCRYERFTREPSLRTAFAYEAIFGKPAGELFAGVYQKVEEFVHARTVLLTRKLTVAKVGRLTARKLAVLKLIREATAPKHRQSS